MSARIPSVLIDFNAFLRDESFAGLCNEVTLPKIVVKTVDQTLAGVGGDIERSLYRLEKLESEITVSDYPSKIIELVGDPSSKDEVIMLKGHLDTDSGGKTCIVKMQGLWKSLEFTESWKPETETGLKFAIAVEMFELEIDGKQILMVDKMNNNFIVNGKNKNDQINKSLGL